MVYNLGFGSFIFRNPDGEIIDEAANIAEFEEKILTVPEETILFHSRFNHFSNWLIAMEKFRLPNADQTDAD